MTDRLNDLLGYHGSIRVSDPSELDSRIAEIRQLKDEFIELAAKPGYDAWTMHFCAARLDAKLKGMAELSHPDPAGVERLCLIGEYCRRHGFIHGAEAEELRQKLEELRDDDRLPFQAKRAVADLLEDVHARDSAAFLEHKTDPGVERRSRPHPEEPS